MNLASVLSDLESFPEASHLDDLTYLFKSQYLPAPDKNSKEFEAVKRMV
jgi:hypothetical protein